MKINFHGFKPASGASEKLKSATMTVQEAVDRLHERQEQADEDHRKDLDYRRKQLKSITDPNMRRSSRVG